MTLCLINFFYINIKFIIFLGINFLVEDYLIFVEYELMTFNSSVIYMSMLFDWMSLLFMSFVLFISSMVIFYSEDMAGITIPSQ